MGRIRNEGASHPGHQTNDDNDGDSHIKKAKAKSFPISIRVPDEKAPRPCEYTQMKTGKMEYCELWYFGKEGLAEVT